MDSSEEATDIKPNVSIEHSAPPPKKRNTANRKERKRTLSMNTAFAELRDHIPNVPPDTKLSKIKTLRLAISYIRYLMEILDDPKDVKPRSIQGFAVDLALQNDAKEKRKKDESNVSVLFAICVVLDLCVINCLMGLWYFSRQTSCRHENVVAPAGPNTFGPWNSATNNSEREDPQMWRLSTAQDLRILDGQNGGRVRHVCN